MSCALSPRQAPLSVELTGRFGHRKQWDRDRRLKIRGNRTTFSASVSLSPQSIHDTDSSHITLNWDLNILFNIAAIENNQH